MNHPMKHLILAGAMLFAALATGCASLDVESDGRNANGTDIVSQLHDDSQGK